MAQIFDEHPRQIIPRWRSFQVSVALGELRPTRASHRANAVRSELERLSKEFALTPSVPIAGELVSAAIAEAQPSSARAAAEFILKEASPNESVVRYLAARVLSDNASDTGQGSMLPPAEPQVVQLHSALRSIKKRLSLVRRSAYDWVDAALLYESLGQCRHASRAIVIATQLAPNDRFVLRSAARFYVHRDDPEQAHRILSRSTILSKDPWVASAEIAASTLLGKTSRILKQSIQKVESDKLDPFHMSELASAVASVQLEAGAIKKAKKLFKVSLNRPTENAVAQASWADRHVLDGVLWQSDTSVQPISYEANSLAAYETGKWQEALTSSELWIGDEPFSARPAVLASYLSSTVFEMYEHTINICNTGLRANPRHHVLLNNLAFAYASMDRTEEARRTIRSIPDAGLTEVDRACISATAGMVEFRSGNLGLGRKGYAEAIRSFEELGDMKRLNMARLFLAMEELRLARREGAEAASKVIASLERVDSPDVEVLRERVSRLLGIDRA